MDARITEGTLYDTLYKKVVEIYKGRYTEEYNIWHLPFQVDKKYPGISDINKKKLINVHASNLKLCKLYTGEIFMIRSIGNLLCSGDIFFKHNGVIYLWQRGRQDMWGRTMSNNFIAIVEDYDKLMQDLEIDIYRRENARMNKNMLLAYEEFLGCGNRLEEADKKRARDKAKKKAKERKSLNS